MHFLSSIGEPGIWETICRQTALLTTSSSNILNPASWDFNSQNLVFRLDSIRLKFLSAVGQICEHPGVAPG